MSSFWSALAVVFVAELGDKTQLVALGFGARYRLGPVLTGIGLAYIATNLLSGVVGSLVGAALPAGVVRIGGGILFLGFAAWTLRDRADDEVGEAEAVSPVSPAPIGVVFSVAGAMEIEGRTAALVVAPEPEYFEFVRLHEQLFKLVFRRAPKDGDAYLWDRDRERQGCFKPKKRTYVEQLGHMEELL